MKQESLAASYITEAFLLLLERKEFKEISVSDICKKAGVARMSFYRHFASKEDVLRKWLASITDQFLVESGISYKNDPLPDYFVKLFTHMQKHKEICLALYKAGLIDLVKGQFERAFFLAHQGEYDAYKSCFHVGGIYNIFLAWLLDDCRLAPEEIARKTGDLLHR